ncbi:MAG: DUF1499 domain-containing protein [Pseudomonadota bacterium]
MRIFFSLIAVLVVATIAAAVYFRTAPMPEEVWHVDPATATPPTSPNFELRQGDNAAVIPAPLSTVAVDLAAVARSEGARRIAGDLTNDFATYVVRSRMMGYPDAVSIRLTEQGNATQVEIFSRSRFGHSDLGVNAARVVRWLDAAAP